MKRTLLFLLASLISCLLFAAPTLEKWDKKYPFNKIEGKTVWQDPVVKKIINNIIPTSVLKNMQNKYDTTIPMNYMNNYLSISGCVPHFCSSGTYLLILNQKNNKFWNVISLLDNNFDVKAVECYSSEPNLSSAPSQLLKEFSDSTTLPIADLMSVNACNSNITNKKVDLSWKDKCSTLSSFAETVMTARQNGSSLSAVLDASKNNDNSPLSELMDNLIIAAYEKPKFDTEDYKQDSIANFRDSVYLACAKALRK